MVKISFAQALLVIIWGIIISFISSVGHDVFDSAPIDHCDLCAMTNGTIRTRFIDSFESTSFTAFKSKTPSCYKHYYVIPYEHIKNIYSESINCTLINEMIEICHKILDEDGVSKGRVVYFDNPPFTTYSHLHLNCMACKDYDYSYLNLQFYVNYFAQNFSPDLVDRCKS